MGCSLFAWCVFGGLFFGADEFGHPRGMPLRCMYAVIYVWGWCMVSVGAGSACPKPHARNRPNGYDICWCIRFFHLLMYSGGLTPPLRWVFMFCRGIPCGARIHPPNTSPVYIHQKHPYAITQQTTCQSFTVPPNVGRWLAPLGWNNICVGDCNSWPSVPPGAWDIPLSIGRGSSWRFAVGCSGNRAWQVLTCRKYVL